MAGAPAGHSWEGRGSAGEQTGCGFVTVQSPNKSENVSSELASSPFSFLCRHSGGTRVFWWPQHPLLLYPQAQQLLSSEQVLDGLTLLECRAGDTEPQELQQARREE